MHQPRPFNTRTGSGSGLSGARAREASDLQGSLTTAPAAAQLRACSLMPPQRQPAHPPAGSTGRMLQERQRKDSQALAAVGPCTHAQHGSCHSCRIQQLHPQQLGAHSHSTVTACDFRAPSPRANLSCNQYCTGTGCPPHQASKGWQPPCKDAPPQHHLTHDCMKQAKISAANKQTTSSCQTESLLTRALSCHTSRH